MSTSQFHTDPLSSTHRFNTRTTPFKPQNPSVPHQKLLSSTSPSFPQLPNFLKPIFQIVSGAPELPFDTLTYLTLTLTLYKRKNKYDKKFLTRRCHSCPKRTKPLYLSSDAIKTQIK